jgi:hypothetical protein
VPDQEQVNKRACSLYVWYPWLYLTYSSLLFWNFPVYRSTPTPGLPNRFATLRSYCATSCHQHCLVSYACNSWLPHIDNQDAMQISNLTPQSSAATDSMRITCYVYTTGIFSWQLLLEVLAVLKLTYPWSSTSATSHSKSSALLDLNFKNLWSLHDLGLNMG